VHVYAYPEIPESLERYSVNSWSTPGIYSR
jgi:hypothetical protein